MSNSPGAGRSAVDILADLALALDPVTVPRSGQTRQRSED